MQPIYEIFNSSNSLGINIFLHKVEYFVLHWHTAAEFLLVLDGETKITIKDETFVFHKEDLIFINAYEPHTIISSDGAVILALQMDIKNFTSSYKFDINSVKYKNNQYENIKSIMARLIKLRSEAAPSHELLMQSLIYKLQYEMVTNYKIDNYSKDFNESYFQHMNKLRDVLSFVQSNYTKDISLTSVAEKFFYSPSYLSRLFENTMGVSFKKYISNLRLSHAVDLLLNSSKSIDEIAEESGFSNTRSFVFLHKESYGCLPSEHRKNNTIGYVNNQKPSYMEFNKTDYLSQLAGYLEKEPLIEEKSSPFVTEKISTIVDSVKPIKNLTHNFKKFCSVGRASDLLRQNVRNMIIEMQNEIGFEYIKFHGLFDDDLSVYVKASNDRIVINFDAIDNIIDFLLSIKLKPLIQLSFMPKAMAKYPDKTTFFRPIVTSEPNDISEWTSFISKFTSHLLSRYGEETVETWPFCVWNEPETSPELFGFKDPSLFKDFYISTYLAVKNICPSLKFGSSSLMSSTFIDTSYFEEVFLSDQRCIPDFLNIHFYPLTNSTFNDFNLSKPVLNLSSNPYIMGEVIKQIKEKLERLNLTQLPIYLTEWNSTTSHRDPINDTVFKGAYVARNIIDNYDDLNSFGYWSLTDDILELPLEDHLFHGGIGLFTKSGIKKPPYYAFKFLGQLGNKLLEKGKGYIITEDYRGFQIVLVNYIHYSDLYSMGEMFDTTKENRYGAFRNDKEISFDISIDHVITGEYLIEEYIVNKEHGSPYDIWLERFNNEEPTTSEAMIALKNASYPKYTINRVYINNGVLNYKTTLSPHEIRLVKMKRL